MGSMSKIASINAFSVDDSWWPHTIKGFAENVGDVSVGLTPAGLCRGHVTRCDEDVFCSCLLL